MPAGRRRVKINVAAAGRPARPPYVWLARRRTMGAGEVMQLEIFHSFRSSSIDLRACVRCVPGWAYKDGRSYMELPAHDLTTSASLPMQQQFYQVGLPSACTPSSVPMSLCIYILLVLQLILDLFVYVVVGFHRFSSSSN